jgi:hypothetical protein
MNRCISHCHKEQFNCEDCPRSEGYRKRTRTFDRVYIGIVTLIGAVFYALAVLLK